jgi:hypothetical protein
MAAVVYDKVDMDRGTGYGRATTLKVVGELIVGLAGHDMRIRVQVVYNRLLAGWFANCVEMTKSIR